MLASARGPRNHEPEGVPLDEFLKDAAAPAAAVIASVAALTALLFDVPAAAPEERLRSASAAARGIAPGEPAAPGPGGVPARADTTEYRRERMNEVVARAMRVLSDPGGAGLPAPAASGGTPPGAASGAPAAAVASADPAVTSVVEGLGAAIVAARNARTEEDLVRAEEALRTAQRQMALACRGGNAVLCQGAAQMDRLDR